MSEQRTEHEYLRDPRSNTIEGWIAALRIFAKYETKGEQAYLSTAAEHDILYLPSLPEQSSADGEELNRLGFHWDEEVDCWAKFT